MDGMDVTQIIFTYYTNAHVTPYCSPTSRKRKGRRQRCQNYFMPLYPQIMRLHHVQLHHQRHLHHLHQLRLGRLLRPLPIPTMQRLHLGLETYLIWTWLHHSPTTADSRMWAQLYQFSCSQRNRTDPKYRLRPRQWLRPTLTSIQQL